jgi:glycosyltransferase involved in cell wall biosynthesis
MKKSVLITSNAYFPNIGGIENSLRYLAEAYHQMGYRVDVVVSDVNTVNEDELARYECINGVHVHRYATTHDLPVWLKPLSGFWSLRALLATLNQIATEHRPELTVSRFHTTTWLAKKAGLANVAYLLPGVVKYQNHPSRLSQGKGMARVKQYLRYYYHVWLQSRALASADTLSVFSLNMQQQVFDVMGKPVAVQLTKPGVDHDRFAPVSAESKTQIRQQLGLPQSQHVLLCIGRFVAAKGFMHALESLRYTQGAHLVLVGGGEQEQWYRDYVAEHSLEERVTFAGVQQDPTAYYQAADSFIMSSTYEPLGQTILEAMSCALPVIAFEPSDNVITATRELLSSDNAIFVADVDGQQLAQAIQRLVDNADLVDELGRQAREVAKARFSWQALAQRLATGE